MNVQRWWWPAGGAVVAATWIGVALADVTRFPPLAAAAAAGTVVLAIAPRLSGGRVQFVTGLVAVIVLPFAVAEAARGGNAEPLGLVLGAVAVLAAYAGIRERERSVSLLTMAIGQAAVIAGFTAGSADLDRVRLAITNRPSAAVVLAGAAMVLAAIDDRSRAERAVLVPVVLSAVLAAPALPPVMLILGWGALAAGAGYLERPAIALAGAAVVATAAGAGPAGLLFAAAAVLAGALDSRLAALCGLPGAVVLAEVLLGRPVTLVGVLAAVALAAVAVALAYRLGGGIRLDGGRPVALVLGGWLVLAPGTWAFSGVTGLGTYDVGAARAVATGLVVALAVVFRRGGEFAWSGAGADPSASDVDAGAIGIHPVVAVAGATVATVASVGWLVVSVVRLH